MNRTNEPVEDRKWFLLLALVGFAAPFLTFMIALANVPAASKIAVLSLVAVLYSLSFVAVYIRMRSRRSARDHIQDFDAGLFDRSEADLSASITDSATGLPNNEAMMLVLQHQLGESHRDRDDRPISVLAIDIEGLSDHKNESDAVLKFAAGTLSRHLRSMDFLARVDGDEFVLILPKTDKTTCDDVIQRINISFASNPFVDGNKGEFTLTLNFGIASFWADGETPEQLVQNAQLAKQRAKAERPVAAVDAPDEYVN